MRSYRFEPVTYAETKKELRKTTTTRLNPVEYQQTQSRQKTSQPIRKQPVQYSELTGVLPPIVQRTFKGVNKLDPFSIPDEHATETLNLSTDGFPALSPREGYTRLGSAMSGQITGLGVRKDEELHAIDAGGTWRRWTGSSWSTVTTGVSPVDSTFTNFKGGFSDINLIQSNGLDSPRRYDGNSVIVLSDAPSGINFITEYAERLYGASGNTLHFSAYRIGDDWTTVNEDAADPGFITIETPDGEDISGIVSAFDSITIFKPNSMHKLFGTSAFDFTVQPITYDIGMINNQCAATIDGILYFLDRKGLYRYAGGLLPEKDFSLPVQWYFDNMQQSKAAAVGTDGQKLYVSIPMNGLDPDTIIEYDPNFDVWNVWDGYSTLFFANMGDETYHGNAEGEVIQMGGPTDNGSSIPWKWVSKPFGSGSLSQQSRWYKMWIVVDLPSGSGLDVYLSNLAEGDSDWFIVQNIQNDNDIRSRRVIIPVSSIANANWIRVKFEGVGPAKIHTFTRQERELPLY